MQRIVHSLSCLLLALALVLAGPGGAGPAKGAMLVELCAGDAASQIWIDADGNPVDPGAPHGKCADCLVFATPLPGVADGSLTLERQRLPTHRFLPILLPHAPIAHLRPLARGPPVVAAIVLSDRHLRTLCRSTHTLALSVLDFSQDAEPGGVTDVRAVS